MLGENVEGELNLSSDEDVDVEEVRCEFRCVEAVKTIKYVESGTGRTGVPVRVPVETWDSATLYSTNVVLSGATHINKGFTGNYPFRVSVPITLKPTCKGVDRRVTWTIKGVAAVRGRPDATSSTVELQIAQPATQPVVKEREVIREVVVAPCKYCGALFPVIETTCPNCGAKRTG